MVNAMYEQAIMDRVVAEFKKATSRDQVNKIYRQARIWNRFHHFFAGDLGCTRTRYEEINMFFKKARWNRLAEIENNWEVE